MSVDEILIFDLTAGVYIFLYFIFIRKFCATTAVYSNFFFFFFYPPADGEKYSFSSPHFHVFSYASCVDLLQY